MADPTRVRELRWNSVSGLKLVKRFYPHGDFIEIVSPLTEKTVVTLPVQYIDQAIEALLDLKTLAQDGGRFVPVPVVTAEEDPKKLIEVDPNKMDGLPCVRGTTLTLTQLLHDLAAGRGIYTIADDHDVDFDTVATVLRDLSATFDCKPHALLVAEKSPESDFARYLRLAMMTAEAGRRDRAVEQAAREAWAAKQPPLIDRLDPRDGDDAVDPPPGG